MKKLNELNEQKLGLLKKKPNVSKRKPLEKRELRKLLQKKNVLLRNERLDWLKLKKKESKRVKKKLLDVLLKLLESKKVGFCFCFWVLF